MTLDNINTVSQIILAVHTLLFYPVLRYAFIIEKRLTTLEAKFEIKCNLKENN